jgi:ABC-type lipoprotein export system ATPase subunit
MIAEVKEVSKYYGQAGTETRQIILNQVSLGIAAMDSIAIVGPSGSGKSTLLNILGTLDQPSSGSVLLDGNRVDTFNENQLADLRNQFIGFIFQRHHLLPQFTLVENILVPLIPVKDKLTQKKTTQRAYELIERVGLQNQMHRRPGQLSVGECQRAAVVRALVNQPRLLLADEPTGSLDAENAWQLGQLLVELNREQELAVVIVTHSMELASQMEKTYRLSSGKLLLQAKS